jgi:hypothetical protein
VGDDQRVERVRVKDSTDDDDDDNNNNKTIARVIQDCAGRVYIGPSFPSFPSYLLAFFGHAASNAEWSG